MCETYPHAPRLDGLAQPVGLVDVAAPHAAAQAVLRVVGQGDGLLLRLEGGHRQHGAEDLLLKHFHAIVAPEHRGLDVETLALVAGQFGGVPARQHLGALLLADADVVHDPAEGRSREDGIA